MWPGSPSTGPEARVDPQVFERIVGSAHSQRMSISAERATAASLFAAIESHPQAHRVLLVRNSKRFQTWGFCEFLVDQAFQAGFTSAKSAVQLAELGITATDEMDTASQPDAFVMDLQGRAWAVLGNAKRIASDLRGSEAALQKSARL